MNNIDRKLKLMIWVCENDNKLNRTLHYRRFEDMNFIFSFAFLFVKDFFPTLDCFSSVTEFTYREFYILQDIFRLLQDTYGFIKLGISRILLRFGFNDYSLQMSLPNQLF